MGEFFGFIWCAIAGLFRSRAALQAEILVLRHQLNILRRRSPKRVVLGKVDRLVFCGLYRLSPTVLDALKILQPETVIRWHRAGFRAYWRWRSRDSWLQDFGHRRRAAQRSVEISDVGYEHTKEARRHEHKSDQMREPQEQKLVHRRP